MPLNSSHTDTIAAIATPPGQGALGIIRVSGNKTRAILSKLFVRKDKSGPLRSHRLYYGHLVDGAGQELVDEVMVALMLAPRSYTKEDMAEIYSHGGLLVLKKVLSAVLRAGARLAEPGEFTRRAFLNGRIDLAQAEAVCQVIQARSERALKWAESQLSGELSRCLRQIKESLTGLFAQIEASLDFPEEGLEIISLKEMKKVLCDQADNLKALLDSYEQGRAFCQGLDTVIVGRPNVGKSSLFNALFKEDRVITSPLPGTTRDFIQETVNIQGLPVLLTDTAGLGEKDHGPLSREGEARARKRLEEADLVLFVVDASQALTEEDQGIARLLAGKKGILVLNKSDLPQALDEKIRGRLGLGLPQVLVSALTGEGLERLRKIIYAQACQESVKGEAEIVVTNLRHKEALSRCHQALLKAHSAIKKGLPLELVSVDLKEGLCALGELTGEVSTEDILDLVFSQFCIGK